VKRANLISLLIFTLSAAPALAQSPQWRADCRPQDIQNQNLPEDPWKTWAAEKSLRDAGAWVELVDAVRNRFERRASAAGPAISGQDRDAVRRQLDGLRIRLLALEKPADDFQIVMNGATREQELFRTSQPDKVVLTDDMNRSPGRQAICWMAHEASNLVAGVNALDQAEFLAFLERRVQRWDNFRSKGFPMLPLELAVNSAWGFPRATLEPPTKQLILLHQSIALEMPFPLSVGIKGKETLLLDIVGVAFYRSERKSFLSISGAAATTTGRTPAWGAVVRFNRPWVAGVMYRATPEPGTGKYLLVVTTALLNDVNALGGELQGNYDKLKSRYTDCVRLQTSCVLK
jgi:hypothetical protein